MRSTALIPALVLAVALVATVGASARPQATTIQVATVLTADQEVPSPTGDVANGRGTFTASVTKSDTGASVSWQLSFSGLTGNAKVRSSGGGLHIADIVGNVDAGSSGGGVEVKQVRGDVDVSSSGGGVGVAQVSGAVTASSSGGGVHVDGVGGRVMAESSGGSVSAVLAAGNSAGGSLSSSGGGVRVTLARDTRLSIDASSSGGSVRCELPVQPLGKPSRTALRGDLNGGGPVLKLRSSGGGIDIDGSGG